jgi:ketosteroid isomerase-like protein
MWDRAAAAAAVDAWMSRYRHAWETNDPDDIRRLCTEDAEYRDGPSTPPWIGHEAILAGWLGQKDEPGTWSFEYELTAVDGDVAVVRGRTSYPTATEKSRRYDNLMVVRLDDGGRARMFTDWWVVPDAAAPES